MRTPAVRAIPRNPDSTRTGESGPQLAGRVGRLRLPPPRRGTPSQSCRSGRLPSPQDVGPLLLVFLLREEPLFLQPGELAEGGVQVVYAVRGIDIDLVGGHAPSAEEVEGVVEGDDRREGRPDQAE